MSKYKKILLKILSGQSDKNIAFNDIFSLLSHLGFEYRTKGSHVIFRKESLNMKINIQKEGANTKPYQVKQIRNLILTNKLGKEIIGEDDE